MGKGSHGFPCFVAVGRLSLPGSAFVTADRHLTFDVTTQARLSQAPGAFRVSSPLTKLLSVQVPLPVAAKAASGDALLVPASGAPLRVHGMQLALASEVRTRPLKPAAAVYGLVCVSCCVPCQVLATTVHLARSQTSEGELLHLPLPDTSQREASLLICMLYARELAELLDSLPAARLVELANVCQRFSCDLLGACGAALVRRVERGAWLTPENALCMLSWAQSRGLAGARLPEGC